MSQPSQTSVQSSETGSVPKTLHPLADYQHPAMPTEETIRRIGWKVWQWWKTDESNDPFIAKETLHQADRDQLDELVAPPACGPLLDEFSATFDEWARTPRPTNYLQLVVLPPCDRNSVLTTWAERLGHEVVSPPNRDHLNSDNTATAGLLESLAETLRRESTSQSVIVIPRLEEWFLRHHDGLSWVLRLLNTISSSKRHLIVGCSSWAWKFLCKSTQAALVLPSPVTPQAFDCDRLKDWLMPLAADACDHGDGRSSVLRFADSGKSVFGDDASQQTTDKFFQKLAGRSRGIPWVAFHLWRRSLRSGPDDSNQDQQKFPEERTIWVSALAQFTLPAEEADAALLILHSLLIHEHLNLKQIEQALPSIHRGNVLPGLTKSGFVVRDGDQFSCSPTAYPSIRERLAASGFPLDEI